MLQWASRVPKTTIYIQCASIVFIALALLPICSEGAVLRVCKEVAANCPYSKVSDALKSATNGDLIRIGPGIFSDHVLLGQTNVRIVGEGSSRTVLQGAPFDSSSPGTRVDAVICNGGASILMRGIAIANTLGGRGGGISNSDCTMTLEDTVIKDNRSANYGGGIFNGGKMRIDRCDIQNNDADFAGGIYNTGTLVLTESRVTNNRGPGLDFVPDSPGGGGILNTGHLVVVGSDLTDNVSNSGGGIANLAGTAVIVKSAVHHNHAIAGKGEGGGVWNSGKLLLVDALFDVNIASHEGGGIFNTADGEIVNKVNHDSLFNLNRPDDCASSAGQTPCP